MFSEKTLSAQDESADQDYSAEEINSYHLELEHLLDRVNDALTHYQVLGLDQLASGGEIKFAYLRAAALLNPSQFGLSLSIPDNSLDRVDQAFEKVSRAFAMLVSFHRRSEYDDALRQGRSRTETVARPKTVSAKKRGAKSPQRVDAKPSKTSTANNPIDLGKSQTLEAPASEAQGKDRRRAERFRLSIPVIVTGYERKKGEWREITRTIDLSRGGVLLELCKRVSNGRVLHLALPMPAELRVSNKNAEPGYCVYALVRRVEPPKKGRRSLGLELLGDEPPKSFERKPWAIFDIKK